MIFRNWKVTVDGHDRLVHPSPQPTYGPISAALRHVDFVAHRHHKDDSLKKASVLALTLSSNSFA